MIYLDRKKGIERIIGTGEDLLGELGCISSSIEEKFAEEIGIEKAEMLVDEAIQAGRRYNREYVYGGGVVSHVRVAEGKRSLSKNNKEFGCENCAHCIPVDEDGYICNEDTTQLVIDNYSPTAGYLWCGGKCWKRG